MPENLQAPVCGMVTPSVNTSVVGIKTSRTEDITSNSTICWYMWIDMRGRQETQNWGEKQRNCRISGIKKDLS